jgi:DnaK suppressor protein
MGSFFIRFEVFPMELLTAAQRVALRQTLTERRRSLLDAREVAKRGQGEEGFRALAGSAHDAGDEAVADVEADVAAARDDRDVHELRQTESALARLDDGTYGQCLACGQPIGFARLLATPGAERCLTCQSSHERAHPLRTPSL